MAGSVPRLEDRWRAVVEEKASRVSQRVDEQNEKMKE